MLPALFVAGCGSTATTTGTLAGTYNLTISGNNGADTRQLVLTLVVD
jgi:hypothetical protein